MNLIVDVTQLVHWQGKLTGIPRVMNELSIRFAREEDTMFVVWDVPTGRYTEVDIEKSLIDRGKQLHYKNETKGGHVTRNAARLHRKVKRLGITVPSNLTKITLNKNRSYLSDMFSKGDVLFVLWGEMNDTNFIEELKNLSNKGVKIAQIAYDLLPIVTPQFSGHSTVSMDNYNRQVLPLCSVVFSISKHTKKDIINWLDELKLDLPEVSVFRLGDDFHIEKSQKPTDPVFNSSGLRGGDYMLVVGTIEARKNHTLLYYMYKLALSREIKLPKIVIVGRLGWLAGDIYEIIKNDPEVKDHFAILEAVSDEELSWLYKNALITVYPSFYEGWGLPIAESISRGIPCASSNTSSMPEIAGDLVEYFNPYSPEECLKTIMSLLEPKNLEMKREKVKRYNKTSWDDTYKQVRSGINKIL